MDKTELTIDIIEGILNSKNFEDLIGYKESQTFEAKSEIYNLDSEDTEKKLEICKDLCSFANTKGGYIIIGLNAIKYENTRFDTVTGLADLNIKDAVYFIQNYKRHIQKHTYPTSLTENIDIQKYETNQKIIIAIKVSKSDKLFLVKRSDQANNGYFMYPKRIDDYTKRVEISEIYEKLKDSEIINSKIDEILNIVKNMSACHKTKIKNKAKTNFSNKL